MKKSKKAVVTVLGLAGAVVIDGNVQRFKSKTVYKIHNSDKKYLNDLPLLIDLYSKEYEIIPIYTKLSKKVQKEILKEEGKEEWGDKIFSHPLAKEIEDENESDSYHLILSEINDILSHFSDKDRVIVDITHGLRHLPILMIINSIMHNIKHPNKIERILFAKEIEREKVYEVIDLKEYLDLSNLSFVVSNFADNYTISKHISVKDEKYKSLIESMNDFSSDVMALSLESLLNVSSKKLLEAIDELEDDPFFRDLKFLKNHIEKVFSKKRHRYETYFFLAKDLFEKGYLVHTVSLLFEGIGFYAKSSFESYDKSLKKYIEFLESEIKSDKKYKKMKDYYELSNACRRYVQFSPYRNSDRFFEKYKDLIYKNIPFNKHFVNFVWSLNRLRNNLLHSNSGEAVFEINDRVEKLLDQYENFCIKSNILQKNSKKRIAFA